MLSTRKLEFGGGLERGKSRRKRTRVFGKATHFIHRSSGLRVMKPRELELLFRSLAYKWRLQVYAFGFSGNHIHSLCSCADHELEKNFLREFGARVEALARKLGKPRRGKFWDERVYGKVVLTKKHFQNIMRYIARNILEYSGAIDTASRSVSMLFEYKIYLDRLLLLCGRETLA